MRPQVGFAAALLAAGVALAASCNSTSSPAAPSPTRVMVLTGTFNYQNTLVGTRGGGAIQIQNSGTAELVVTRVVTPPEYSPFWTGGVINPGGAVSFSLGFNPQAPGVYSGTVVIEANQTSGTNTLPVSGTAVHDMRGSWAGTLTVASGGAVETCAAAWSVTMQSGAQMFGTFQMSGNSQTCAGNGNVTGFVSPANELSRVSFDGGLTVPACARVAGDGIFAGGVSADGAALSIQTTETVQCPGLVQAERTVAIALSR